MHLIRTFADHHQGKNFKCFRWNPKSCGYKYRILYTGEIIERYTGKTLGYIENKETVENLSRIKGRKLDIILLKFI